LTCLVVDDNHVNLDLAAQMLRKLGCQVVSADSGADAVQIANSTAFDIIFMDLNMPGMSGIEAIRILRASGRSSDATIIALTADSTFNLASAPLDVGLDGVLHKPVRLACLKAALPRLPRAQRSASQELAADQTDPITDAPDIPLSNFSDLFDLIGRAHGHRLLVEVLCDIEAALQAIHHPDTDTPDTLHRAIGSTAAVGLLQLSQHLRHGENLARAQDADALLNHLPLLEGAAQDARQRIAQTLM